MNQILNTMEEQFFGANPSLNSQRSVIMSACNALIKTYEAGGKLLTCGNGGSCSDSEHIVGELMKGFMKMRPLSDKSKADFPPEDQNIANQLQYGLPAISLCAHSALISAFANDVDPDLVYAQQVYGYGVKGDILMGISTSGNAKNVVAALKTAKAKKMITIGLTGKDGGAFKSNCDYCIIAPHNETYRIQEFHIMIYHFICAYVEAYFFEV